MKIAWIDTLVDYPIYGDVSGTRLFSSSYDISLPLALVYLRSFLISHRPHHELRYYPRRLSAAEGRELSIEDSIGDADLVLTSCSAADSGDARQILEVAKRLKKTTIVGGIYPRFSNKAVLAWGVADFIATGEGEHALITILDAIEGLACAPSPWPGVMTDSGSDYIAASLLPLDTLPQPVYDGLPIARFQAFMRSAYVLATRGCPAPCHFCTSARLYGYSYRKRTVESVVKELDTLYQLGFTKITFADDTIAVDPSWTANLFSAIANRNPGYRLKVRARADELNDELLDLMVDAGVELIQFGVESINLTTREMMYKQLSQSSIEYAFDAILKRKGLIANPLYMLAYPGETWNDLESNASFITSVGSHEDVMTYMSFTTPYPGTPFADQVTSRKGVVLTNDLRYYTNKFPVFLPHSLLDIPVETALNRLVSAYEKIADVVNRSHPTQFPIPNEFFSDLSFDHEGYRQ